MSFITLPSTIAWKNGGRACDMLVGPCACGAFHFWADVEGRAAQVHAARPGSAVQKYRDRVIQLESLIARIKLTHLLEPTTSRIVDHVFDTSIAKTEPGQFSDTVVPFEQVVEELEKKRKR